MNKKNIIINSTIVFVIATMWQQTLHELGHFVMANLVHAKDVTLYHNYVAHDSSALGQGRRSAIAAIGPLVSLAVGICFDWACSRYAKRDVLFLFMLFMSAFGYINFGGYLMVSPFFKYGDTG